MPRTARLVVPHLPHHVIQRGNRRQPIFADDRDRRLYLKYLATGLGSFGVTCQAWCLMDNHVHLILTPPAVDALRAVLTRAHTRFAQWVNRSQNLSGHLFQGRFLSYPMDERHLIAAARYIENNPVKARLVEFAEDWPWSSARAHVANRADGLTDVAALGRHVPNWRAYLRDGAEASERDEAIEAALRNGRPQGTSPELLALAPAPGPRGRRWPARQAN
ncbi:MAG: transposase [Novosphingobium sp.]|nr:transposase [Novosphingobium sp.]